MDGMSTLARMLSDPESWRDREALACAIETELDVEESEALSIASTLAHTDQVLAGQAREEAALRLGDARLRRRAASEINDNVVQGLAAAVYALELGNQPLVGRYLRQTLQAASQMMTDLLEQGYTDQDADQTLLRSAPASLQALDTVIDATG